MHARPPLTVLAALAFFAGPAVAQTRIAGLVYDSVSARPLAGATVQLIADSARAARTTASDSIGRFEFTDVPPGRYTIGFFHAKLDSLGLDPILRGVTVRGEPELTADLAIPSVKRIRTSICGPVAGGQAVVLGIARDAGDGTPLSGTTVTAEWVELRLKTRGAEESRVHRADTTTEEGWFAFCDVPSPGTIALMAQAGDDSARILIEVPERGILRRDLNLVTRRESPRTHPLRGVVTAVQGGNPVAGALVTVDGGTGTRTDTQGRWSLDAPLGTRMLEVRAIGFYPVTRVLDVSPHLPDIAVALFTMRAMLDTIRITATRLSDNMREFEQRRRALGAGRFVTAEDIARRRPTYTTDVFRTVPGLTIELVDGMRQIQMRGVFGDFVQGSFGPEYTDKCSPGFYVNGVHVRWLATEDLDALVNPEEIAGVEVYREPHVPAQFSAGMSSRPCGSIVIWTNPTLPTLGGTGMGAALRAMAFFGATALAVILILQVL